MTQKEAIIEALRQFGGKAKMSDICKRAQSLGDFCGSKKPENTIRNCIYTNTQDFRSSGGGWWELVSYQEEIASRDKRIKELEAENERLRKIPTEDDFVRKFVKEAKHFYKHDRKKADAIRQIMIKVGRADADADIDAWIEGKEQPLVSVSGDIVVNQGVNIDKNYGPNIEQNGGTLSLPGTKVAEQ